MAHYGADIADDTGVQYAIKLNGPRSNFPENTIGVDTTLTRLEAYLESNSATAEDIKLYVHDKETQNGSSGSSLGGGSFTLPGSSPAGWYGIDVDIAVTSGMKLEIQIAAAGSSSLVDLYQQDGSGFRYNFKTINTTGYSGAPHNTTSGSGWAAGPSPGSGYMLRAEYTSFSVDSIDSATAEPGDTRVITGVFANATGKTVTISGATCTVTAQTATTISFTVPYAHTHGNLQLDYNTSTDVLVTDAGDSGTIALTINPPTGRTYGALTTATLGNLGDGITGQEIGDKVIAWQTVGTGATIDATNLNATDVELADEFTRAVFDINASPNPVWSAEGVAIITAGVDITPGQHTLADQLSMEKGALYTSPIYIITDATAGEDIPLAFSKTGAVVEYRIQGGSWITTASTTIQQAQTWQYRAYADDKYFDEAGYEDTTATFTFNSTITDTATFRTRANLPPLIDDQTFSILNGSGPGVTVANLDLTINHDDTDQPLTWRIISGNTNSDLAINSSTGVITTANTMDDETTASYTLVVGVDDGVAAEETATITVSVVNSLAGLMILDAIRDFVFDTVKDFT